MSKTESAIALMESMANNPAHGYDQGARWGERGDYDCSSAVITAWEKAGVPVKSNGATYTGNMYSVFLRCGFKDVTGSCNLLTGAGLRRGDVLLNHQRHTAMYCGDGREVEASINEMGNATGGQPGDQTGREFLIRSYRNYPWDCVLRYMGEPEEDAPAPAQAKEVVTCTATIPVVKKGDTGAAVAALQAALKHVGYDPKWIDGDAGTQTNNCIVAFQAENGLDADGICGKATWEKILSM